MSDKDNTFTGLDHKVKTQNKSTCQIDITLCTEENTSKSYLRLATDDLTISDTNSTKKDSSTSSINIINNHQSNMDRLKLNPLNNKQKSKNSHANENDNSSSSDTHQLLAHTKKKYHSHNTALYSTNTSHQSNLHNLKTSTINSINDLSLESNLKTNKHRITKQEFQQEMHRRSMINLQIKLENDPDINQDDIKSIMSEIGSRRPSFCKSRNSLSLSTSEDQQKLMSKCNPESSEQLTTRINLITNSPRSFVNPVKNQVSDLTNQLQNVAAITTYAGKAITHKALDLTIGLGNNVAGGANKIVEDGIEYVDDVFLSKAWLQLLGILVWILSYVVDIGLDLYFAFNDILGKYIAQQMIMRNTTNYEDIADSLFLGYFPIQYNQYFNMFWIAIGSILIAYVSYSAGCVYIIYFTNLVAFDEYRIKIKTNQKEKITFWSLLIAGVGPNYFLWNDLKMEWKFIEGDTVIEKLKSKCLVWLDMYIHTLHLIHTMMEDIPLLYLYIYLSIIHYDDFIANSIAFYPTVISSFFFFIGRGFWVQVPKFR